MEHDSAMSPKQPAWDSTPIQLRNFCDQTKLYVFASNSDWQSLVTQGYITSKGLAVVNSAEHAQTIEEDQDQPAAIPWGWENPQPVCSNPRTLSYPLSSRVRILSTHR